MVKKKKRLKMFLGIGVFLVILAMIALFSTQFGVPTPAPEPGSFISVPTYGTLSCEKSGEVLRVPASGWTMFDTRVITCGSATGQSLPQSCDVTFKMPTGNDLPSRLSRPNIGLLYSVCTSGSPCSAGAGDVANNVIKMRDVGFNQEQNFNREITERLNEGQFIVAEYQEVSLGGNIEFVEEGRFAVHIEPWVIERRDVFSIETGRIVPDSLDCEISSQTREIGYAIKSATGNLGNRLETSSALNSVSLQQRRAVLTYISNFVAIPPQFSLFDDDTRYCTNRKIYRVDEVETNIGTYKVANTNINGVVRNVECCTIGDVPPGFTCENFERVAIPEESECGVLNPCDLIAWTPTGSREVVRQECIDNECVTKTKEVECSGNSDCPSGICFFDVNNPDNNRCETITPVDTCGNGICEDSLGETNQNCPKDCLPKPPTNFLIFYILGGILAILIITLIALQLRKK